MGWGAEAFLKDWDEVVRVQNQTTLDGSRLRRVRDRIDREYAQLLDVEALARGAQMSAGHLSRRTAIR